jgi:hypothetical protein
MKILKVEHFEDCIEGAGKKELVTDEEITQEFIQYLGQFGKTKYFPTFAKPFFKLEVEGEFILKGVEGNKSVQLILKKDDNNIFERVKTFLEKYN